MCVFVVVCAFVGSPSDSACLVCMTLLTLASAAVSTVAVTVSVE